LLKRRSVTTRRQTVREDGALYTLKKGLLLREISMKVCTGVLAAVVYACMTGCAAFGKHAAAKRTSAVDQELSSIMGADLSTAVGILGFPSGRNQKHGGIVYIWTSDRAAHVPETEIRMGSYAEAPPSKSPPSPSAAQCRVELSADDSGRIAGYEWWGGDERCGWVVRAFERAAQKDEETQRQQPR
jgi:hypothetical protein